MYAKAMRTILRMSFDGDTGSVLRNKLAPILTGAGFTQNGNTGTWENGDITEGALAVMMLAFWDQVHNPPNHAKLDHFWMYSDHPPA